VGIRDADMNARRRRLHVLGVAITAVLIGAASTYGESRSGAAPSPWVAPLQRVETALASQNVSAAEEAWHEAHRAALGSRQRWDGLIEVGEAYLRIGEVGNRRHAAAQATARRLYLAALFRARQQGALDGVLRTAEAFAALGDREVVTQCLYVAGQVAERTRDPQAPARIEAFRARWGGESIQTATFTWDPLLLHFPDESVGP
jgi:hypothetical protein